MKSVTMTGNDIVIPSMRIMIFFYGTLSLLSFLVLVLFHSPTVEGFAPIGYTVNVFAGEILIRNPIRRLNDVRHPFKLYYIKEEKDTTADLLLSPKRRFDRTADASKVLDNPCILTIDNVQYNLTAWAKAHPGGATILEKFNGKDASKAFHSVRHSKAAYEMLKDFAIHVDNKATSTMIDDSILPSVVSIHPIQSISLESIPSHTKEVPQDSRTRKMPRWRQKLFTREDPVGIHKYLGIYCLLHFIFRYFQMLVGDPSAGLGSRVGRGPSLIPALFLLPHAMLSLSSLIFHTVPAERVIGRPMIWKEFRAHNIIFGLRSVVTALACSFSIYFGHTNISRTMAVGTSVFSCLFAMIAADIATEKLRVNTHESTTATMPYWDGCSVQTQRRFKWFYAYCQFMATIACCTVTNPAYPVAVLLAIQLASLLMTLVRKGLLSARGYHYGYTATLIAPYFVAFRSIYYSKRYFEMPSLFGLASLLFVLRRCGISKYLLWVPLLTLRLFIGDSFLDYAVW